MKKRVKIILSIAVTLSIAAAAFIAYVGSGYKAETDAINALTAKSNQINVVKMDNGDYVFEPDSPACGFIFYAGGKVQHEAYASLMRMCAERGILSVLPSLNFDLAILDGNAADGYREMYPDIDRWYIGGHSLGGVMAADYASKHLDEYSGLVLLGAYTACDLSGTDLAVLSIYGSEDQVLNREKYEASKDKLPAITREYVLEGGNHAGFGDYGDQKGDGNATITSTVQEEKTADLISEFMQVDEIK